MSRAGERQMTMNQIRIPPAPLPKNALARRYQEGKIGYALLWLLGVPIPVLVLIYALRGCT